MVKLKEEEVCVENVGQLKQWVCSGVFRAASGITSVSTAESVTVGEVGRSVPGVSVPAGV